MSLNKNNRYHMIIFGAAVILFYDFMRIIDQSQLHHVTGRSFIL